MAGRKYCKNTVKGHQRGKKYPAKLRAEVVMDMLHSNSICEVARRHSVPESTIRSWMAQEAEKGDVFAEERRKAAREIAVRAAMGTLAQVSYLQERVDEAARAEEITRQLHRRLDEDTRASSSTEEIGMLLKSEEEMAADAAETGLVTWGGADTRNRVLYPEARQRALEELERYEGRRMSDKDAAAVARTLMEVAQRAAEMSPDHMAREEQVQPVIQIGAIDEDAEQSEVVVE